MVGSSFVNCCFLHADGIRVLFMHVCVSCTKARAKGSQGRSYRPISGRHSSNNQTLLAVPGPAIEIIAF